MENGKAFTAYETDLGLQVAREAGGRGWMQMEAKVGTNEIKSDDDMKE
jgi:hypothetical protein